MRFNLVLGGLKTIRLCQQMEPLALPRIRFPAVDEKVLLKPVGGYLSYFAGREIKSLSFLESWTGQEAGGRTWPNP